MKLLLGLMLVGTAIAARLENTYLPPSNAATAGGHNAGLSAPFAGPTGQGAAQGGNFGSRYQASASFNSFSGNRPSGSGASFSSQSSGSQFSGNRGSSANFGAQSGSFQSGNAGAYQGGQSAGAFQGGQSAGAFQGGQSSFQSGSAGYQGSGAFQGNSGFASGGRPVGPAAPIIPITKYSNNPSDGVSGAYSYSYETGNGINFQESGQAPQGAQGSFSYTGDDGQQYAVTYVADANGGFQAQGAHLPTPPPIPEEILRALEKNAADEAAGIFDDGTYKGNNAYGEAGTYSGVGAGAGSGAGFGSSGFSQGGGASYNQGGASFNQGGSNFAAGSGSGFSQGAVKQTTQGAYNQQRGQGAGNYQGGASFQQSTFVQSGNRGSGANFGAKNQGYNYPRPN